MEGKHENSVLWPAKLTFDNQQKLLYEIRVLNLARPRDKALSDARSLYRPGSVTYLARLILTAKVGHINRLKKKTSNIVLLGEGSVLPSIHTNAKRQVD